MIFLPGGSLYEQSRDWWSAFEPARRRGNVRMEERYTMALIDGLLQELEQEASTTRRVLERVPEAKLTWKPHPKARTLGELALHVAMTPGAVAEFVSQSPVQAPDFSEQSPKSASELVRALDESVAKARRLLATMDDKAVMATWRMMKGDRELLAIPRMAMLRSIMLNHWYHHRGQLSVYLRQLDVPVPSIYGPSADENPFG
jgi:uncharacterized damage-inducible protein DinB